MYYAGKDAIIRVSNEGRNKEMELYAIVDTETTNGYLDANGRPCLDDSLVYDIAIAIIDESGKVYDTRRYVCDEIFNSPLMLSAYFADKIPEYVEMVNNREMIVLPFMEIYADARKFLGRYNVCGIMAHNAKFDYRALNNTLRYLSGSKRRYFFPYAISSRASAFFSLARPEVTFVKFSMICDETQFIKEESNLTERYFLISF